MYVYTFMNYVCVCVLFCVKCVCTYMCIVWYCLVCYAHTVISHIPLQMSVPAVPVFISASGLCDVQYTITVACRDAFIYTYKKWVPHHHLPSIPVSICALRGNTEPKYQFAPGAQVCGLVRVGKNLVIGLANKSIVCYTPRVSVDHVMYSSLTFDNPG